MAKLRSMTETIKMLSTENVALREENDGLVMMRGTTSGSLKAHDVYILISTPGIPYSRI